MRLFGWDTWRGSFRGSSSEEQQDTTTSDTSQDTQDQEAVRMDQLTPERKEVFTQEKTVFVIIIGFTDNV
ncbi:hypothetical protein Pmani_016789 [Petrolisthes manimaculis]|uniref:Uncharacterized protein n=1 Tax=Petrolisthes manimaculis TaxID=1843537 RepID=A0AAE1U619_9EUCA|nr:hypothetical protein Pmani_016789 [Petrolisthes manimaculis]